MHNPTELLNPTARGVDRMSSTTEIRPENMQGHIDIEYFFASDASAVIEHTKQVIFLEDDDVACVREGGAFCGLISF